MKHHPKLKRGLACMLSMLCLASVCAGAALAAAGDENTGNEDIQLRFINNKDGTDYTAQILTGDTIQVQMTLDDFSMPSSTQANQALLLRVASGTEGDVNTVVSGGGARGVYTLTPTAQTQNMQEPVTYVATGNVNSITPPKSGYVGMVVSGGASDDVGARLVTSQAISERSTLTIQCVVGESPNHSEPEFIVTRATGAFAPYANGNGKVGVVARESNLSSNTRGNPHYVTVSGGKRITFTLSQEDQNPGDGGDTETLRSLKLSFVQIRQYDQIFDDQDGSKYLEENENGQWVIWKEDGDPETDDHAPNIRNNYIRQGTTYTLTFDPPSSTNLYLRVATPQYVAEKEIQPDLAANNRTVEGSGNKTTSYPYLELAEGDTQQLVARDSMKLITKDERWNATFDIHWEWIADEGLKNNPEINWDKAKTAVQIPSTQNSSKVGEVTATVNRQENDVTGVLVAKVLLNGQEFQDATATFPLTIRGAGIPASIQPYSQEMGQANSVDTIETLFDADARMPAQLRMDVFAGGIEDYQKAPTGPFEYVLQLNMGLKNAKSYYAVASLNVTDGKDVVELLIPEGGTFKPYAVGTQHIDNPSAYADFTDEDGRPMQGTNQLMIRAKSAGRATLTIQYYIMLNGKYTVEENSTRTLQLIIDDTAPKQDATLSALSVEADTTGNPAYPFGFDSAVTTYSTPIELPYAYENYILRPTANEPRAAERPIKVTATDISSAPVDVFKDGTTGTSSATVISGRALKFSLPDTSKVVQFTFEVTAHDPRITNTYTIFVRRAEPSEDDTLSALGVYAQADQNGKTNFITGFDPNQRDYVVTVPYSTQYLRVSATPRFPRAELAYTPALEGMTLLGTKEYIKLESCTQKAEFEGAQLPYFKIDVTPEINLPLNENGPKGEATGHYRIFINRLLPSENSLMSAMSIVDAADTAANPKSLSYTPNFNATNPGPYRLTDTRAVPYSTSAVRFKITPQDKLASAIRIYNHDKTELLATITNPAVFSEPISLKARSTEMIYNEFVIEIVSEAGDGRTGSDLDAAGRKNYYTEYRVQIERAEANTDADLLSVTLNEQEGAPLKMFSFHRDETHYEITVPYAARSVSFTAKTSDPNATIQLKDHDNLIHAAGLNLDVIVSGRSTKLYKLNDPGSPRTFDLIVTAEDGKTTKTYTFVIDREPPSSDALLKKLTVEGLTEDGLTPIFKPNDTAYSAVVEDGADGVYITPTANDKNATIMVDGMDVESGQTSELIELLELNVKLEIVVTAEDGLTQKIYTIDLYNQNLVDKTNNADLSALKVERGVMTPEFKASVTEYEVTVKEDTWSVDIIPKQDDPLAEIKVLSGTRELGDYNGNYGLALTDGENQVTVQVTSPDKTQVKEYNITIYRNQEDALKTLTPLTADDVDFENSENPIVISISEYPRIESSVFNALKEYPEKTIIFQGLDYSLTFQAANLNTVIPTREIYDFRLSFESMDAEAIKAYMGQWEANAEIMDDLVMIYFDYHGDLPGPAMLNLKLGNKYGGQILYWHYYNRERKVIEFYGTLRSNAQGSISVPINHFSTYLLTRDRAITGSENYGNTLVQILATIGTKQNPTTGADGIPGDGT